MVSVLVFLLLAGREPPSSEATKKTLIIGTRKGSVSSSVIIGIGIDIATALERCRCPVAGALHRTTMRSRC